MQRNLVIAPTAASSSIEITEIDLGSALFAYNNVFIGLDRSSARKRQTYAITYALECKALNLIRGLEGSDLTWKI